MRFSINIRNRHFLFLDLLLIVATTYTAFVFRLGLDRLELGAHWPAWGLFTAAALLLLPLFLWRAGLYAVHWRYASVRELLRLSQAVGLGAIALAVVVFTLAALQPRLAAPRTVPFIFFLLALGALAAPRLAWRIGLGRNRLNGAGAERKRVLIMGAGDAGAMILREIQGSDRLDIDVVGFVDDDPLKRGMHIHGVPVLGARARIPHLVQEYAVREVIIAMPTAPGIEIRDILAICEQAGVPTKTMPGVYELINGRVSVSQLREVQIEDLLRRDPVQTDIAAVEELLRGRRVLVTGAGGSIGSELARQILRCRPHTLTLLGHGENAIFAITRELKAQAGETQIRPLIADIRFRDRLHDIFAGARPHVVFHAAAHKHVPLMEHNPCEAITNNVLGTRNLLQVCGETGVQRFVMISTDKAVNPTSVMGASKRLAELLVYHKARQTGRAYVAVRFGNVLGSRGSVLLTFREQIAAGGPVTVTHPDMRRYFMTIPEAVQLVLQASVLGQGGEVFVLDMGQPVRIIDLARDLISLSGLQVGRDIDIHVTGLRPGEKMFEELFLEDENYDRTAHEKIFVSRNGDGPVPDAFRRALDDLIFVAWQNDGDAVRHSLCRLLPEARLDPAPASPTLLSTIDA